MISTLKVKPAKVDIPTKTDLFSSLRALDASHRAGMNKNDRAVLLIGACIASGVNTVPHLIGVLKHMNVDRGHLIRMLELHSGSTPGTGTWRRNPDGT